ncbi:MAG: hypothetical protein RL344_53 [Pseudomonadota bacterium]|jgi:S-adenosylmethionine/arginine decarboxylase-like enzyme
MSGVFNNFNSSVGIQVAGNYYASTENLAKVNNQIDLILAEIRNNSSISKQSAMDAQAAINNIKQELESKNPEPQVIERALSVLGSIASIASVAAPISTFLKTMF